MEIPVTNEQFNLKKELIKNLVKNDPKNNTLYISDPDTLKNGDTLDFVKTSHDTVKFKHSEDNIDTQTYHAVLGPFPLIVASKEADTFPLPAAAGNFSASLPFTLDKVYETTFYDTVSNVLSVNIDNLSSSELANVIIGITGVDTQTIAAIAANGSATVNLSVAGKSILQTVTFIFSGTAASAGPKQLGISFTLNGLVVSKCKVDDHLVSFSRVFNGTYDITDTIAMDYIDIGDGYFNYVINNHTDLNLQVNVEHQHLWQASYCKSKGVENVNDLYKINSQNDTLHFSGDIIKKYPVNRFTNNLISKPNISNGRLLTLWDPIRKNTYTGIKYSVVSLPKGDTITISATDSMSFTVYVTSFSFKEFLGTVMEPIERAGNTQKIAISLPKPFNQSMKDSLRGNLLFSKVNCCVQASTQMPERSFIDTMQISYDVSAQNAPNVRDTSASKFCHVKNDTTFKRTIDITNVTNQFPDTAIINTKVRIPKGTRMRVCNDLTDNNSELYHKYTGQMTVKILANYDLTPKLDWKVLNPATLDLGGHKFSVVGATRMIRKLENRRVMMNFKVINKSNLNMHIYGLIAPSNLIDTLDSLSTNEFSSLIFDSTAAEKRGFVNFLGSYGVLIPQRNTMKTSEVKLSNSQIETILSSDSCSWRWLAIFEKQGQDAMCDTDYVDIHSKLRFEGTNSTDSMMIWRN